MKEYVEMGLLLDAISVSKLDYLAVADVVCKVPTADVAPVVKGIWVEDCDNGETSNWACSVCGCIIAGVPNDDEHPLYAFCPNCGARMVEE